MFEHGRVPTARGPLNQEGERSPTARGPPNQEGERSYPTMQRNVTVTFIVVPALTPSQRGPNTSIAVWAALL